MGCGFLPCVTIFKNAVNLKKMLTHVFSFCYILKIEMERPTNVRRKYANLHVLELRERDAG